MTILKLPAFIDVSHWNKIVDWTKVDSRICGVIMKATQGKYYVDPTFSTNWKGAKSIKKPVSAYHFFDPNDVPAQAINFLTTCEDVGAIVSGKWMGEIPPVLDAEYQPATATTRASTSIDLSSSTENSLTRGVMREKALKDLLYPEQYLIKNKRIVLDDVSTTKRVKSFGNVFSIETGIQNLTPTQLSTQYKAFLDIIESELGVKPIIYTSSWQWAATNSPTWARDYLLWTAQYPYNPDGQNTPKYFPYGGWTKYWGWQYDEKFQMTGIEGNLDVNVYNGTQDEWNSLYGGTTVVQPPTTGGNMLVATNKSDLNLRSTPTASVTTNIIITMPANTHIEGTEIVTAIDGSKWLKTVLPQAGYCASWLLTYETPPTTNDIVVNVLADSVQQYNKVFPAGTKVIIEVS